MEDIRFQIKLPGYEEQEEEGGKTSETSEKPKADKSSKRSKARPESRPRRRRSAAAERCDRCCYCCVLCCESVFFTVGSAIRILMSVVVVGLMFWTALYVYTITSEPPPPRNTTNTTLLRTLDALSAGYSNPARRSRYLGDPAGSEADDGLTGGSDDLNKTESSSASSSEPGGRPVTLADSDNSPRGPAGGGSDDLVTPRGSSYHHGDTCSDKSCPDNSDRVRSGGPVHISDDATDSSDPADPSDVIETSIGPGTLVDTPDEQGDE